MVKFHAEKRAKKSRYQIEEKIFLTKKPTYVTLVHLWLLCREEEPSASR